MIEVHKNTPYRDLEAGLKRLQTSVEKRTETLKQLVKSNFDRFVGAKSTVDAVYRDLKAKNLDKAGYGTEDFSHAMNDATEKANEVFQPIIDRKIKADKIRNTLGVLERFKFFFSLPANLHENINRVSADVHDGVYV
jgi:exocyst complex component 2